jgi:hypothetical protein
MSEKEPTKGKKEGRRSGLSLLFSVVGGRGIEPLTSGM